MLLPIYLINLHSLEVCCARSDAIFVIQSKSSKIDIFLTFLLDWEIKSKPLNKNTLFGTDESWINSSLIKYVVFSSSRLMFLERTTAGKQAVLCYKCENGRKRVISMSYFLIVGIRIKLNIIQKKNHQNSTCIS